MIPVLVAAERNTRSAAENDNPILHPAGFYRTADYEDIERIKAKPQQSQGTKFPQSAAAFIVRCCLRKWIIDSYGFIPCSFFMDCIFS